MGKPGSEPLSPEQRKNLREIADRILKRSEEIRVSPQKEEGLELARMLLSENRKFGERELRDPEIIEMLRTRSIGVPTFRKCLSVARKEILKLPRRKPPSAPSPSPVAPKPNPPKPTDINRSIATNVDRNLL
jgi:hypothetical protein